MVRVSCGVLTLAATVLSYSLTEDTTASTGPRYSPSFLLRHFLWHTRKATLQILQGTVRQLVTNAPEAHERQRDGNAVPVVNVISTAAPHTSPFCIQSCDGAPGHQ